MSQQLVSYYGSLVTQADYDTLSGRHWLNDNIISFAFEYMDRTGCLGDHVTLLDPTVCQAVKLTNQAAEILASRSLLSSTAGDKHQPVSVRGLLCVVSDSSETDRPGGDHWSLLAVRYRADGGRADGSCGVLGAVHADSLAGRNLASAVALADALHPALCVAAGCGACGRCPVAEARCAQQGNCHDCGAYALLFAERLLAAGPDAWPDGADLCPGGECADSAAAELRQRYRRLIMQLRADGPVYK